MMGAKVRIKTFVLTMFASLSAGCVPDPQMNDPTRIETTSKHSVSFTKETKVKVHSDIKLHDRAAAALVDFRTRGRVYGAMYVTRDGSAYSWMSGRFSIADAKEASKVDCEAFHRRSCVLLATLGPASPSEDQVFIPLQARSIWTNAMRETRNLDYIAIAANKTGESGFAWDFGTAAQARKEAIGSCERNASAQSDETIARIRSAKEAAGIYQCRLVGVFR